MIPFSFQKGNKSAGCEDAPPIANERFSVICDGLGGAGSTKHTIIEDGATTVSTRTSGYLGSRIVAECVKSYYSDYYDALSKEITSHNRTANLPRFLESLKDYIQSSFEVNMKKWDIKPSHSRTLKDFPTTLASALYFPSPKGVTILAVWAGDSRVYLFTPKKGLQLLTLDDAKNAEDEMNSASEMTNCISSGNAFSLNFAIYELNEPGVCFCCSDGCFDYLQSPLHFEWLLLHTILECMPNAKKDNLGVALADSIKDNMYISIGDDTTMSGVIYMIESSQQMKKLFKDRMVNAGTLAIRMNDSLKELKKVQNERESAQKTCRLFEERIFNAIRNEVCMTLKGTSYNPSLRSFLASLPFFSDFSSKGHSVEAEIEEECEIEIRKIQETAYQTKNLCRNMFVCDYLKWQRQMDEQGGTPSSWGRIPLITRGQNKTAHTYDNPSRAIQSFLTCIEMYKHPYFRDVVRFPAISDDEIEKYIQSQIILIEQIVTMLNNNNGELNDLWSQAFFSTNDFSRERNQNDRSPQFEAYFDQAINNPQSSQIASALTKRKINEYLEQGSHISVIREKYEKERQRRLDRIPEEFWNGHKNEIIDAVLSENEVVVSRLFVNTDVSIDRLVAYSKAKKTLSQIDEKIKEAQISVDENWLQYKSEYQLFRVVSEKGVC